ncbi:MAG: response regulator transcription factor [Bacilli bacterium]
MRILIVEDEFRLAELMENRLKKENYEIDISLDGEDGCYKAMTNIYDLIILDIMLPLKDGFSILKELKINKIDSKIIILTAKNSLEDKLDGLNNGADDYLTKPFHMEELVARVNNKLRNNNTFNENNFLSYGDIKLDLKNKVLKSINSNEEIEVLYKEFLLLECLLKNGNQIVSKEYLYDNVWGMENDLISNNLEVYISFIRKKLKAIGSNINIKSMRGFGYKLEIENEEIEK